YPSTPRGAVDRIRMGMTTDEVSVILNSLQDWGQGWNKKPVRVERWVIKDGEVVYTQSEEVLGMWFRWLMYGGELRKRKAVPSVGNERLGMKYLNISWGTTILDKVTRDGIIVVVLDNRGGVCGKIWLEFPRESSNPLERFWSWLPF